MIRQKGKTAEIRVREIPQELLDRGRDMVGVGRDIWLAGLGALAVVGEEGSQLFDRLVESGEELETRGKEEIGTRRADVAKALEEQVYDPVLSAFRRFGVPTRSEMERLTAKVDTLTRKVDALVTRVTGEPADEASDTRRGLKVYKVVARGDGWAVDREGREPAVSVHATKDEALEKARTLAHGDAPSRLDVYKKDGTIQESFTYGG
jgi:polyhydroxyalkanoate synthesis regulator phasin